MIKGLTNLIELLILFTVLVNFFLLSKTFFSQLSNLNLVISSVKELPFILFEFYAEYFYFLRQPLDLDGLEHHDKLHIFAKVGFLIVGEVLDARSNWIGEYLRRSSP